MRVGTLDKDAGRAAQNRLRRKMISRVVTANAGRATTRAHGSLRPALIWRMQLVSFAYFVRQLGMKVDARFTRKGMSLFSASVLFCASRRSPRAQAQLRRGAHALARGAVSAYSDGPGNGMRSPGRPLPRNHRRILRCASCPGRQAGRAWPAAGGAAVGQFETGQCYSKTPKRTLS
jgi:hypothetical protein